MHDESTCMHDESTKEMKSGVTLG